MKNRMAAVVAVLMVYLTIASFTGLWPTEDNPYRSYSLQACAWLEGRLDLDQDYPWLELAVVDGRYYVSFPPFPSMVLLPFAAVFGADTPDHFISLAVTLLGAAAAVGMCRRMTDEDGEALFCALYLYLGNGYMFITAQGWVWFLAQAMCFTLSLLTLDAALRGRAGRALLCWACAVGCRPMVAVYLPLLLCMLWRIWREQNADERLAQRVGRLALHGIPAGCMAALYMGLNVARFGSPFEFGHNYLPEFTRSAEGQFSLTYLADNLGELLRLPQVGGANGALIFPTYDCMAFWLISPLVVTFLLAWLYALGRRRRERAAELALFPAMLAAHLLVVLCHRTLGGWQFGNRYLLDMMPWLLYGVLAFKPKSGAFLRANVPMAAMGAAVNLIGTAAAYNHWI